jgi:hypothetical protein
MPKTRESNGSGALYLGTLIVIVSVVIWSEYKTYYLGTWIALCAGGFVLWFIGFASTRHLTSAGSQVKSELAGSSRESCLKTFSLNGYFFQPIEQETSNGRKQFRLSSTLPLSMFATLANLPTQNTAPIPHIYRLPSGLPLVIPGLG